MGRQVFTAGEILTAANMNDLGDQTVMVFDDATARATAIPTPVEGMVTYLKDTDRVDKFDGTNFVNVDTGGLVAVKSVVRTSVFTVSLGAQASADIADLSITHTLSSAGNKLLLSAQIGLAANIVSTSNESVGIAFAEDGSLLNLGDASGSMTRTSVNYVGRQQDGLSDAGTPYFLQFLHSPGAGSKTYSVRVINSRGGGGTMAVNRSRTETTDASGTRTSSTFTLMEVAV